MLRGRHRVARRLVQWRLADVHRVDLGVANARLAAGPAQRYPRVRGAVYSHDYSAHSTNCHAGTPLCLSVAFWHRQLAPGSVRHPLSGSVRGFVASTAIVIRRAREYETP